LDRGPGLLRFSFKSFGGGVSAPPEVRVEVIFCSTFLGILCILNTLINLGGFIRIHLERCCGDEKLCLCVFCVFYATFLLSAIILAAFIISRISFFHFFTKIKVLCFTEGGEVPPPSINLVIPSINLVIPSKYILLRNCKVFSCPLVINHSVYKINTMELRTIPFNMIWGDGVLRYLSGLNVEFWVTMYLLLFRLLCEMFHHSGIDGVLPYLFGFLRYPMAMKENLFIYGRGKWPQHVCS